MGQVRRQRAARAKEPDRCRAARSTTSPTSCTRSARASSPRPGTPAPRRLKAAGDADTARAGQGAAQAHGGRLAGEPAGPAHRDEVSPLLELGAALREATATLSGPQLRQLSRQRNEVVQALVQQARRLAADAGSAGVPGRGPCAAGHAERGPGGRGRPAELLLQGRLAEPLEHSGFGRRRPAPRRPPRPAAPEKPAKAAAREPHRGRAAPGRASGAARARSRRGLGSSPRRRRRPHRRRGAPRSPPREAAGEAGRRVRQARRRARGGASRHRAGRGTPVPRPPGDPGRGAHRRRAGHPSGQRAAARAGRPRR